MSIEHTRERRISIVSLGVTSYKQTWDLQHRLFELRSQHRIPDILLLNEHFPVYTLGKNSNANHLLTEKGELEENGIDVFEIERGGDITFHGPGQIVGYPILDLSNHYLDLHKYLRDIEEVLIRTLADFSIIGKRDDSFTGVWVGNDKIAAIGVKTSHWITMHGFALNVNTDLSYFERIIPCGIFHKGVTSLQQILNKKVEISSVADKLTGHFGEVFNVDVQKITKEELTNLIYKEMKETSECLDPENR